MTEPFGIRRYGLGPDISRLFRLQNIQKIWI